LKTIFLDPFFLYRRRHGVDEGILLPFTVD
jgi:hypothetical protein